MNLVIEVVLLNTTAREGSGISFLALNAGQPRPFDRGLSPFRIPGGDGGGSDVHYLETLTVRLPSS